VAKISFLSFAQNQIITFEHFTGENMTFNDELLAWYHKNARDLPWRSTHDPYRIWLSEIILQQTRVEQGMPYYHRFITEFPTLKKLAASSEETVLRLWQGLGYYSRGRNLLMAAQQMIQRHKGFPKTYNEIRALKGIGDYTAAAISSFAFNLPHAVVDGNVYRFFSRCFGISTPIDTTAGKKEFKELAESLLDRKQPGIFNQAIMEMGALLCKPKPDCNKCPFAQQCIALKENAVLSYPVKAKTTKVKDRYFYYLLMKSGDQLYIKKREGKDIWQGLYEFPLIETEKSLKPEKLYKMNEWKSLVAESGFEVNHFSKPYIHKLSHQVLHTHFVHLNKTKKKKTATDKSWKSVSADSLKDYGMPQLIVKYIDQTEL
jgi:A/G-specific adenine glycosylase